MIPLFKIGRDNAVMVFNANDAFTLITEHRIVGSLLGCLPQAPRQNQQLGLPLLLQPEEVTLLIEKGIGVVYSSSNLLHDPQEEERDQFINYRQMIISKQVEAGIENKKRQMCELSDTIVAGKLAKLQNPSQKKSKKRRRKLNSERKNEQNAENETLNDEGKGSSSLTCKPSVPEVDGPDGGCDLLENLPNSLCESTETQNAVDHKQDVAQMKEEIIASLMKDVQPMHPNHCTVQISTESSRVRHVMPSICDWTYPQTPIECLRYRVFKDLWEKNYYLTKASKFGGDFLVYPGDPQRFHAHYIAVCLPYQRSLSPLEVVSYGRLGTTVKKTILLCSLNDYAELVYMSLQWTGIS